MLLAPCYTHCQLSTLPPAPVPCSDPWAGCLERSDMRSPCSLNTPKDSRQHYEIEYRHRAANLEKCMSELWHMERKRDKNAREMKVQGLGARLWGDPLTPS